MMIYRRYCLHSIALLLFITSPSLAQLSSEWRLLGPKGWKQGGGTSVQTPSYGRIQCIASIQGWPEYVFVGTETAGLWVSTDAGESWEETTRPLGIRSVANISICTKTPTTIFALTDSGVIRSTNGGHTWAYSLKSAYDFSRDAVATTRPRVAVAQADPSIVMLIDGWYIYRSTDGGKTWRPSNSRPDGLFTYVDVIFHPTIASAAYVVAAYNGNGFAGSYRLLRTADGGRTFTEPTSGFPQPVPGWYMSRVLVGLTPRSPGSVRALVAGGVYDGPEGVYGLYLSHDGASSFVPVCCGDTDGPEPNDPAYGNPNLFGVSPTALSVANIQRYMAFAVSDLDPNQMMAGGPYPWRSTDGGRTWNRVEGSCYGIRQIVYSGGVIWMAADNGVFRSTDNGRTFHSRGDGICAMRISGITSSLTRGVLAVASEGSTLFAYDPDMRIRPGTVGGWVPTADGDVRGISINPVDDRFIYYAAGDSRRLQRAVDTGGAAVSQPLDIDIGGPVFNVVEFDPNDIRVLLAPDYHGRRIVRSTDNGVNWSTVKAFEDSVLLVRASMAVPGLILAVADGVLWNTQDNGAQWKHVALIDTITAAGGRPFRDLVLSSENQFTLWAITGTGPGSGNIIQSTDGGRRWANYSGMLARRTIRAIVAQQGTNDVVYVATDSGVFYRNRWMNEWQGLGTGLPSTTVNGLAINYRARTLCAATDRGVWECTLPLLTQPRAVIACDRTEVACSTERVNFTSSAPFISPGATVQWSFPGGVPATSTNPRPTVSYSVPGTYDVTLIVTSIDPPGSDTHTFAGLITVKPGECGIDSVSGRAALFTGAASNYMELPSVDLAGTAFTFRAWVKPAGVQEDSSAIITIDSTLFLGFKNGRNELALAWKGRGMEWNSGLMLPPDIWSHVVAVTDSGGCTLYVNGRSASLRMAVDSGSMAGRPVRLGQWRGDDISHAFRGLMDEVCLYRRSARRDEVLTQMHLLPGRSPDGLVAYYQFNETGERTAYDRIGTRHSLAARGVMRAPSLIPMGPGRSFRTYVAGAGGREYEGIGFNMEFPVSTSYINGDVVAWRINARPDSLPPDAGTHADGYWILRSWGSNSFTPPANVTFREVGTVTPADVAAPSRFKLYRRDASEDRNTWGAPVAAAVAVDAATRSVTFAGNDAVGDFGQFIVANNGGATLGVGQASAATHKRVVLYPNPCDAVAVLHLPASFQARALRITVYDLLGRAVLARDVPESADAVGLDLGDLPAGIYVAVVGGEHLRFVRR